MNDTGGKCKTVELHITHPRHPLAKLARVLRETVAVNFGKSVLVIHNPDGTEERYGVYPGACLDEYEAYCATTLKHTGTKQ